MATSITFYNIFREKLGEKVIDLESDTFKVALCSSSYTPDADAHEAYTDLTNELSGNGYPSGGASLSTITWTKSGATVTFDADDVVFTASGGSIVARYAVLYDDTVSPKDLICYWLLDTTPADVTASDGNTLTLTIDLNGIFKLI